MTLQTRVYRLLLLLYPRSFRDRFAADMCALFADLQQSRSAGPLRVWMRTVADLVRHAPAAWLDAWRERSRRSEPAPRSSTMNGFVDDCRVAIRRMAGAPGFTLLNLLTLALAIGGTTAVFSVVSATLLERLPYPEAERLVRLEDSRRGNGSNVAWPNLIDWREQAEVIELAGAYTRADLNFSLKGEPVRVRGALTTPDLFAITGTRVVAGRGLTESDRGATADRVVVIGEELWTSHFGRDHSVVGATATVDGVPETVVGVISTLPGLSDIQAWRPLRDGPLLTRRNHFLVVMARLRKDVSLEQARSALTSVAARLATAYPESNAEWTVRVTPLHEALTGSARPALLGVFAAVALVLLIASASLANLTMARALTRTREFAVRAAIGAGRRRLVRQLLTECALVAAAGGAAALLFAWWATNAAAATLHEQFNFWNPIALDPIVLGFAAIVSIATAVLFGLAPALQASRTNLAETLKSAGTTSPAPRSLFAGVLLVAQLALVVVLLSATGLLVNDLARLMRTDLGLNPEGVVTARIAAPRARYSSAQAAIDFYDRLVVSARLIPGVSEAAVASDLALAGSRIWRGFVRDGDPLPDPREATVAMYHVVTAGYFAALRIPFREGGTFDSSPAGEPVAVINESMARQLWGRESAVGRSIRIFTDEDFARRVVGVVADTRQAGIDAPLAPQYYVPFAQAPRAAMSLVVRTTDAGRAMSELRTRIKQVDPDLPLYDVRTYEQIVGVWTAPRRFAAVMLSGFTAVALLISAIGIAGVMGASVARRTREVGVRMAMGATRRDILHLILRDGLKYVGVALVVGAPLAFAAGRALQSALPRANVSDWRVQVVVVLITTATALAAAWVPARRASRVEPLVALRDWDRC